MNKSSTQNKNKKLTKEISLDELKNEERIEEEFSIILIDFYKNI